MGLDPGVAALNTSVRPSGESAKEGTFSVVPSRAENSIFSGGKTGKRIASGDDGRGARVATNSVVLRSSAVTSHGAHARRLRAGAAMIVAPWGSLNNSSI